MKWKNNFILFLSKLAQIWNKFFRLIQQGCKLQNVGVSYASDCAHAHATASTAAATTTQSVPSATKVFERTPSCDKLLDHPKNWGFILRNHFNPSNFISCEIEEGRDYLGLSESSKIIRYFHLDRFFLRIRRFRTFRKEMENKKTILSFRFQNLKSGKKNSGLSKHGQRKSTVNAFLSMRQNVVWA